MWPGTDMVARTLIEEREHKINRAEVMRALRREEDDLYTEQGMDQFWAATVVVALLVVVLLGGAILA